MICLSISIAEDHICKSLKETLKKTKLVNLALKKLQRQKN